MGVVVPPYHKNILDGYSGFSISLGFSIQIWQFFDITGVKLLGYGCPSLPQGYSPGILRFPLYHRDTVEDVPRLHRGKRGI